MKTVNNIIPTISFKDLWFLFVNLFKAREFQREVEKLLKQRFPDCEIFFTDSGRTALRLIAKSVVKPKETVLLQSFTCSAVCYPFLIHNRKVLYSDISPKTFNLEFSTSENLLKKANYLLIQYNFGIIPESLDQLLKFVRQNNLILIEDLAHSFGLDYKGKPLGSFGDFVVLSFGRDKVVSSVMGGALLVRNKRFLPKIKEEYKKLRAFPFRKKLQIIFYLLFMLSVRPFYGLKISRIKIFFLQKLGLLPKVVTEEEKKLKKTAMFKFPTFLFPLLYNQLLKLDKFARVRSLRVKDYNSAFKKNYQGALLKYPLLVKNRKELLAKLKKEGIFLSTWYSNIIDPKGVDLLSYKLNLSEVPQAVRVSKKIINLPTLVDKETAEKVIRLVKKYAD